MKAPTVRAVEAFCFLVIWAVPTNASFPQEHIPNVAAKNKGNDALPKQRNKVGVLRLLNWCPSVFKLSDLHLLTKKLHRNAQIIGCLLFTKLIWHFLHVTRRCHRSPRQ